MDIVFQPWLVGIVLCLVLVSLFSSDCIWFFFPVF